MKTDEKLKTVFRVSEHVESKAGEMTRKDVYSNNNGAVTVLGLGNAATIARHQVNSDVMVTVLQGAVEFEFDDNRMRVASGESFLMAANTPHTVTALDDAKVMLVRIHA